MFTNDEAIREGTEAFRRGSFPEALELFRASGEEFKTPLILSREAFCLASAEQKYREAVAQAVEALRQDSKEIEIYLNLGRIYVMAGQKKAALRIFRLGLRLGNDLRIIDQMAALGVRRPPPFQFLPREHFLNKYTGILLRKLGLR